MAHQFTIAFQQTYGVGNLAPVIKTDVYMVLTYCDVTVMLRHFLGTSAVPANLLPLPNYFDKIGHDGIHKITGGNRNFPYAFGKVAN
jgi:hypothetical protein